MNKTIDIENIEEEEINSDNSSTIEIKPKKERKKVEYIFTEARKIAFENAQKVRQLKRDERKIIKQLNEENNKQLLEEKIIKKAENIKKKSDKKEKILDISENEEEPELKPEIETVIIKKKKPKKKIIIVESESEEDEIIIKKKKQITKPIIDQPIRQIKKYVPIYY